MIKTYRIELKNKDTNKIEFGRTIWGDDLGEILKLFYDRAYNEIGAARIALCNMSFYEI